MPRKKRAEGTRAPNGASSIYLGKDGKWHGRVTVGTRDDGRPDRRHVERRTEKEVIDAVRALERQRDAGLVPKTGRAWTLRQWLDHWLTTIAEPSVRPSTFAYYESASRLYLAPGLGAHRVARLEAEHVEKFYARLRREGRNPSTVHQVHRTLRAALNEAVRRGHQEPGAVGQAADADRGRDRAVHDRAGAANPRSGSAAAQWRPVRHRADLWAPSG